MASSTLLRRLPRLVPRGEERRRSSPGCATAKNRKMSLKVQAMAVDQKKTRSLSRASRRSITLPTMKMQRKKSLRKYATSATGTRSRRGARSWPGVECSGRGCMSPTRRQKKIRRKKSSTTRMRRGLQKGHQLIVRSAAYRHHSRNIRQQQSAREAAQTKDLDYAPSRQQGHHSVARSTSMSTGAARQSTGLV